MEGTPELSMGLWSGKLKHRMATAGGYSTVDLLNLTALIPDRCVGMLRQSSELIVLGLQPAVVAMLGLWNDQLRQVCCSDYAV